MSRSRRRPTLGSGLGLTPGGRIALRPLSEDDIAAIAPWYQEAVAAAMIRPDSAARRLAIVRQSDGTVIGLLDYRENSPGRGWLSVSFIALARGQRGWGYGSEAVRLIEAEGNAERFCAKVDARNGLGLYFWLRLGYRPARPGEVPGELSRGMISIIRTVGDASG